MLKAIESKVKVFIEWQAFFTDNVNILEQDAVTF